MFKELFTESLNQRETEILHDGISKIIKNKYFVKHNVTVFDDTLYFEFSDSKGVLRLHKKISDDFAYVPNIKSNGAGNLGYYDGVTKAALQNPAATAYYRIQFDKKVPQDVINVAGAKVTSNSDYQKILKQIIES